ncbi:MAG: hypothetical protein ATN35_09330 [Epulopiscium sp. Nele67-Bin004]|nr:MAG: hypothetical protein ATN35_09330 [Epulopiscium sp. Nele67-Bin004]
MDKYSSGLVSQSFWFVEVKKIINLLNENATWEEIKVLAYEENLLLLYKMSRIKRVYGYLKNRISTLDRHMLQLFQTADVQTQKLINLIAITKDNRLFFEFLYDVYSDKAQTKYIDLTPADASIFFKLKADQEELIASWNEITLKRLGSVYINFMVEAGLITKTNNSYKITPPILDIQLENYLIDSGEANIIKALTGEELC